MLTGSALRIMLYGRHSTALQTSTSSTDQITSCGPLVAYLRGTVVGSFVDPEQSGYRRDRPGLKQLLRAVENGEVDIIVCEALDRLARDAEDVAWLGKKLAYHRVQLHTISEHHVDEIKFAVAGMLGAIFLKHLVDKTLRGMAAAVAAGRFAGGRAYGYKRVIKVDAKNELVRGLLEVDEAQAEVVQRIYCWFAAGLSSVEIATRLNSEGVPGPRGGEWNASTIRGDPTKLVGILNNPLYVGRLVWGRREWRRNPDSEKRERRYRLRDSAEWVDVAVPDLRIIDDGTAQAVATEMKSRQRPVSAHAPPLAGQNRQKHLLLGLIRCCCCGSNYTISGKDYYRCAGQKERGTCGNTVSVRKAPLEAATMAILQHDLLTEEHARLFVEEFTRETARLARSEEHRGEAARLRLGQIKIELDNLCQNLLIGLASPALRTMIKEREVEKAGLEANVRTPTKRPAEILPHPALLDLFTQKVGALRATLDDASVRTEAAQVLATLIESIIIHPGREQGAEAEVVAKVSDLMAYATNDNAAPKGGVASSIAVVAGTGFEPVTFRL